MADTVNNKATSAAAETAPKDSIESKMNILMFKGKPLIRQGNFVFYGFPSDPVILALNIIETRKDGDLEIATRVAVQIQRNDNGLSAVDRIVKQCEKKNFYDAFEIGSIWLERELKAATEK